MTKKPEHGDIISNGKGSVMLFEKEMTSISDNWKTIGWGEKKIKTKRIEVKKEVAKYLKEEKIPAKIAHMIAAKIDKGFATE
jgi:hypothetical protein